MELDIFFNPDHDQNPSLMGFSTLSVALRYFSAEFPTGISSKNQKARDAFDDQTQSGIFFDIPGENFHKIVTSWWDAWEPNP